MKIFVSCLASACLLGSTARAQNPVPAAPAASTAVAPSGGYQPGRSYRVETVQGTTFLGVLSTVGTETLEFDSPEIGHVSLRYEQVRRATLQAPAATERKLGYYDIGNGNSLFAASTGRNLRKQEGSAQTINLFLVGASYGFTDNFSLGLYASAIPGVNPGNQLFMIAPKVSTSLGKNLNLGVGAVYANLPLRVDESTGLGVVYGAITYGPADNNLTLGVSYGFVSGEVSNVPVLQLGGQKRLSRRISLVSENHIVLQRETGMGGLYGLKINWPRTRLGLGAAYFYQYSYIRYDTYPGYVDQVTGNVYPPRTEASETPGEFYSSYIVPLYIDFTVRFGKGSRQ